MGQDKSGLNLKLKRKSCLVQGLWLKRAPQTLTLVMCLPRAVMLAAGALRFSCLPLILTWSVNVETWKALGKSCFSKTRRRPLRTRLLKEGKRHHLISEPPMKMCRWVTLSASTSQQLAADLEPEFGEELEAASEPPARRR